MILRAVYWDDSYALPDAIGHPQNAIKIPTCLGNTHTNTNPAVSGELGLEDIRCTKAVHHELSNKRLSNETSITRRSTDRKALKASR